MRECVCGARDGGIAFGGGGGRRETREVCVSRHVSRMAGGAGHRTDFPVPTPSFSNGQWLGFGPESLIQNTSESVQYTKIPDLLIIFIYLSLFRYLAIWEISDRARSTLAISITIDFWILRIYI